jgi:hypothetical protein
MELDITIKVKQIFPQKSEKIGNRSIPGHMTKHFLGTYLFTKEVTVYDRNLERNVTNTETFFKCPKCFDEKDYYPEHGEQYKCSKCNLKFVTYGAGLRVWK